jgi:predicted amidohydrolase
MRIAALQMLARAGDVTANLAAIADAAEAAKARGADLLVAPELATTGYGAGDAILELAESADGQTGGAAGADRGGDRRRHRCRIRRAGGERVYNAAALLTPAGERMVYRKRHLYGPL